MPANHSPPNIRSAGLKAQEPLSLAFWGMRKERAPVNRESPSEVTQRPDRSVRLLIPFGLRAGWEGGDLRGSSLMQMENRASCGGGRGYSPVAMGVFVLAWDKKPPEATGTPKPAPVQGI